MTNLADLRAAAQANLRAKLAALPPIDTDERWCDPCLAGRHGDCADLIDAAMACWCPCDGGAA